MIAAHPTAPPSATAGGVPRVRLIHLVGFAAALIVLGLLIYAQVGRFDFINLDDDRVISGNPWLRNGLTWNSVQWAFTAQLTQFSQRAEYWEPLTLLSRLADSQLFGMNAGAFHLTNLAIHLLNAFLLAAALYRLTGKPGRSAVVALLFLAHPMNVEPVCWLSARKDLLNATFFFCTLLAYARYAHRRNLSSYLLVLGAFAACLMGKPMGVTVPFVLLLLDAWPLGRWKTGLNNRVSPAQILAEKLPLLIGAVCAAALAVASQKEWKAIGSDHVFPLSIRIQNAVIAYATYLRRLIWPSDLAIYYPHAGHGVSPIHAAAAAAVLILITALAFRWRARFPFLLMGWLWFGLVLGPVIGLVQIGGQAMADRYAYLSTIGIFIAAVWWIAEIAPSAQRAKLALTAAVVAGFALLAAWQVHFWKDSVTVFGRAVAVTEANQLAYVNLGAAYEAKGEFLQARAAYGRAVELQPSDALAWSDLAEVERALGQVNEAVRDHLEALRRDPSLKRSLILLSRLLKEHGKLKEAETLLLRLREVEPHLPQPCQMLSDFYGDQGRWAEAAEVWKTYLLSHPGDQTALQQMRAAQERAEASAPPR